MQLDFDIKLSKEAKKLPIVLSKDEILKDLFQRFSTREEMEKLIDLFRNFPISQLYK